MYMWLWIALHILLHMENLLDYLSHVQATAQKNRILKSYLFRGTRYSLTYEICTQN